ncbi:MAG TPA: sigma-70 family RNA polymerase sigma factor [Tepidisphaeraceae bacterium]|nr:sigma-70 family RNA polymerase sigma factor [Tepidisphaeraceae bacterium]
MVAIYKPMLTPLDTVSVDLLDDDALLAHFVDGADERAFAEIVRRHSRWLFSLALRALRDRHLAEDVTQAVFIILHKKAAGIRHGTPLCGWLFKTCRFAISDAHKRRTRLQRRETRAAELMRHRLGAALVDESAAVDEDVSRALDESVAALSESDRHAVLLRFFEEKSLAEVGVTLGITEEAAKKRVARAVERLRKAFARRGMVAPAALLLLLLGNRSAEAADLAGGAFTFAGVSSASAAAQSIAAGAQTLISAAYRKLLITLLAASVAVIVGLPTLGSAVVSAVREISGGSESARPRLAELPAGSRGQSTLDLPSESKFADLWIGYRGQILWRSDAYTAAARPTAAGAPADPFVLRKAAHRDRPYAVGVDKNGAFFIKPLDPAALQAGPVRQALFDYDQGPYDPASRVSQMLSLIDPEAAAAGNPAHAVSPGSSSSASSSTLPNPDSGRLADGKPEDWQQLRRLDRTARPAADRPEKPSAPDEYDGPFLADPFNTNIYMPELDLPPSSYEFAPRTESVPEPGALALLTLGAALLLRRRSNPRP